MLQRVLLTVDINSQIPVYFENSLHRAILVGNNSDLLELKFAKEGPSYGQRKIDDIRRRRYTS